MTDVAARARRFVADHPEQVGFGAIVAFVLLTSLRDVYLWSIFRTVSPLHVAVLSFGLGGLCFLPRALARHRHEFRLLLSSPFHATLMNLACAVSWIAYFCALRALEPSLAQMLCAGVGPITADLAEWRKGSAARSSRGELGLHVGMVVSLGLAVALSLGGAGWGSGATYGVAMAVLSGVTLAIYRISCSRLSQAGVAPVTILAVRSPIIALAAAALAWSTGDTALGSWSAGSLAVVSVSCVVLIVLPIYVNQVGVALASPVTSGVASALQPTVLWMLQVALRVRAHAPTSAVSMLVYSALAVAASVALARRLSYNGGRRDRDEQPVRRLQAAPASRDVGAVVPVRV